MRLILISLAGLGLIAGCEPAGRDPVPSSNEAPDAGLAGDARSTEAYGTPPSGTREALPQTVLEGPGFTLTQLWQLDGFNDPQGVLQLPDGSYLVANSGGGRGEIDADGWISKISADGEMLAERFATSMTAPGGMVLDRGLLYVADGSEIHMVDPDNGILLRSIPVRGAAEITDIAALNASLYAIDGSDGTLFQVAGAEAAEWLQDDWLTGAQSLSAGEDMLAVPVQTSGALYEVTEAKALRKVFSGVTGLNAAAPIEGGYIATAAPGRLVHIEDDGTSTTLLETDENGILQSGVQIFGNTVITLNPLPGSVTAWQIDAS